MEEENFKSGFVSIIGRPNVGKSTLLNTILGEKIAITTSKPQTTRNRITGIKNTSESQIIFWDTPGIHKAKDLMNRAMVKTAISTIADVDLILFMIEADKPPGGGDEFILSLLREAGKPVILLINKIDLIGRSELLPLMQRMGEKFDFAAIIPVSARRDEGVETLLKEIAGRMKPGPRYFSEDMVTECPERFIVSEMIREKIFILTKDELPYKTAVEIELFQEKPEKNVVVISAVIYVEREAHKSMIIGKAGGLLKKIGSQSRSDIEKLLGAKVFLELYVKVKRGWSGSESMLRELGLDHNH